MLLERGELASVSVLVDEGRAVEVFGQVRVGLHVGKRPVLDFVLPALLAYQLFCRTYLPHILLCRKFRHGQYGTFQDKVVDACRLVRYLIQQPWGVLFQFEPVGGFHQGDLLARYYILHGDIPADDTEHLTRGQLLLLPLLYLLLCGTFRRLLVAEFRDQRFRLVNVPVQLGVGFQLVHVLGELVLEHFQFLLVDPVGLAHQVEAQPVLHLPCLMDAIFQLSHGDELLRVVGLHFDMQRLAQEYHDFRMEVVYPDRGEGSRVQSCLADKGKVVVDIRDPGLFPELALHERAGYNDHQDACRVKHVVGFVQIIFL